MTEDELLALADRVEGRSSEYDPALCDAIHSVLPEPKCIQPPNYCASIDAAMTLVPEGWSVALNGHPPEPGERGTNCAEVFRLGEIVHTAKGILRPYAPGGYPREAIQCATPALALCAAALKVRATQASKDTTV